MPMAEDDDLNTSDDSLSDLLVYSSASTPSMVTNSSTFPMPECLDLPASEWLASAPKTPLDDKFEAMDLQEDDNQMVRSWLEDVKHATKHDHDGLDQWLMVPNAGTDETFDNQNDAKIADDDDEDKESSIIVLGQNEDQLTSTMEVESVVSNHSWKFW